MDAYATSTPMAKELYKYQKILGKSPRMALAILPQLEAAEVLTLGRTALHTPALPVNAGDEDGGDDVRQGR